MGTEKLRKSHPTTSKQKSRGLANGARQVTKGVSKERKLGRPARSRKGQFQT